VRNLLNEQVAKENPARTQSKSSDSSESTSSIKVPKELSREQQVQYFNRKMSAKQDQELKDYVREFRKKAEKIYQDSKINKTYKFPRVLDNSASSMIYFEDSAEEKELEHVTYYDLRA